MPKKKDGGDQSFEFFLAVAKRSLQKSVKMCSSRKLNSILRLFNGFKNQLLCLCERRAKKIPLCLMAVGRGNERHISLQIILRNTCTSIDRPSDRG